MAKFEVRKNIKLDFLGEGWEDCKLVFSAITINESRAMAEFSGLGADSDEKTVEKATNQLLDLLESKFIEGTAYDGKDAVKVKADDIGDLPTSVIPVIVGELAGEVSPKG